MSIERNEILDGIKTKEYDIAIIGGGVSGGSIALSAARAGLSVVLFEQFDFASGASSKTMKTFSGLFTEMHRDNILSSIRLLRERRKLTKKTSASPIGILMPIYEGTGDRFLNQEIRVLAYEVLAGLRPPKGHKIYSKNDTKDIFSDIIDEDITASIEYFESSVDDARYTLELIMKAKEFGAHVLNYMQVTSFGYTSSEIKSIIVADMFKRKVYEVSAKNIIISSGAWGSTLASIIPNFNLKNQCQYYKGTHIFTDSAISKSKRGIIFPKLKKNPHVYALPFKDNNTIIGTTHKKYNGQLDCIYASSDEVEYLLDVYNTYFYTHISKQNVTTTQSALHPVDKRNFKIHKHPTYNCYLIDGASMTMSAYIAQKILHSIYPKLFKTWNIPKKIMYNEYENTDWILTETSTLFLIEYFGYTDLAMRLNEYCKDKRELLSPIANDERIPRGLIHYFVEKENALHLNDIMSRRMRFILSESDCGTLIAEYIAAEMGSILGWSDIEKEYEIKRYRTEIKRNRVSLF